MDPFLQGISRANQVDLLHSFAVCIREGRTGQGNQVRAGSVSEGLCAIGKTIQLAHFPNPLYDAPGCKEYTQILKQQVDAYRKADPASQPQLAVPVGLTKRLLRNARTKRRTHRQEAIADLVNVAFFYLLRVGEYTAGTTAKKQTVPFRLRDITFRKHGRILPRNSPLELLLTSDEATLRISNQKNGEKNQAIHNQCTGTCDSPIKSLARRVHHLTSRGASIDTPIFCYAATAGQSAKQKKKFRYVSAKDISKAVKDTAEQIGLFNPEVGYVRSDVSSHSLRAGGAMAMHLAGVDTNIIRKQGRWKSDTFLMYIHEQISAFSAGVSAKMSTQVNFRSIKGPDLRG